MTTSQETQSESDKCQKEREKRQAKYKMALVRHKGYYEGDDWDYQVVSKKTLMYDWWMPSHEVICDDQPERVLRAMKRMMEEK